MGGKQDSLSLSCSGRRELTETQRQQVREDSKGSPSAQWNGTKTNTHECEGRAKTALLLFCFQGTPCSRRRALCRCCCRRSRGPASRRGSRRLSWRWCPPHAPSSGSPPSTLKLVRASFFSVFNSLHDDGCCYLF